MAISGALQLSLISDREWSILFSRLHRMQRRFSGKARSLSFTFKDLYVDSPVPSDVSRRVSACTDISDVTDGCDPLDDSFYGFEDLKIKED